MVNYFRTHKALYEKATLKKINKAVNTDWLAANISPTKSPAIHTLQILVTTATAVKILMDDGTNSNIVRTLNDGTSLDANEAYTFQVIVPAGYSYNVQHVTTTQDIYLEVVEEEI